MKKLMLLMQLANLLLIGVSSEDTLCQYSGRQWQNNVIDYNNVLEYSTIHPYKDWMVCSGAYKLGPNCAGAVVSCEKFSTVASKGCRWGDYISIIEKDTGSYKRFCRNKGPLNYKPKGDFKLRFVSNGRKTAYGVSCQITCPEPIVPPVDCTLSQWGAFSDCSVSCGNGTKTRQRSKETEEANGGTCSGILEDTQKCEEDPCPVDCTLSQWEAFSDCSVSCGDGTKTRQRSKETEEANGGTCLEKLEDTVDCNQGACQPVDCELTQWSQWTTTCSKTCGGGSLTRQRSKFVEAAHGGQECVGDLIDSRLCNQDACPKVCASGWTMFAGTGKCYRDLGWGPMKYEVAAKSLCPKYDASTLQHASTLTSVVSYEEAEFLLDTMGGRSFGMDIWLGAEYKGSNTYAWLDGSPWSYDNWKVGHPQPTTAWPSGECVALSHTDGTLVSKHCDHYLNFYCKTDPQ